MAKRSRKRKKLFTKVKKPSFFRKLACVTWDRARDPQIYGYMNVDMSSCLAFMDRYKKKHGHKLSVTHVILKAVALAYRKFPDLNVKVERNHLYRRNSIDVNLLVSSESGGELSAIKLNNADKMTLAEIVGQVKKGAKGVRDDRGPDFQESKNIIKKLPVWISRIIVPVMSWLVNKRGMHFPGVGFPQDPFGTVIVTSVGMFGVETAFAPLPSIGRANAALLITEVKKKPWVEDDNIVVRPVMKLCCTLDHRVFTGYQGAMLSSEIKDILTNPKRLLET